MRTIIAVAVVVAAGAALAACASTASSRAPMDVQYTVIDDDVTIPFAQTVNNFRVGLDRSLILDGVGRKWYRATLSQPCKSDLNWEERIGLVDRGGISVSKFSEVIVNGRRCQILSLDEIADPKPAEDAARAAAAAAAKTAS